MGSERTVFKLQNENVILRAQRDNYEGLWHGAVARYEGARRNAMRVGVLVLVQWALIVGLVMEAIWPR